MRRLLPLFVLLLSCTSVRVPPDTTDRAMEGLPPLPDKVWSPLGDVPVIWLDTIPGAESGFTLMGRFHPMHRQIWIWKGVRSRQEQWRVLLHEECHLRHWDYGMRFHDETLERMCDVFAYARVAELLTQARR